MSTKVVINESPQYKLSVTDGTDQTLSVTNGIELQVTANVGGQGPAGPNEITTSTSTNLTGFISGNGTSISSTVGTTSPTASTIALRNAFGGISAKHIRLHGDTYYAQINPSSTLTQDVAVTIPTNGGLLTTTATAVTVTGEQTAAGAKTFSGQMELTGQSAINSTSALTRGLGDSRYFPSFCDFLTLPVTANSVTLTIAAALTLDSGIYYFEAYAATYTPTGTPANTTIRLSSSDNANVGFYGSDDYGNTPLSHIDVEASSLPSAFIRQSSGAANTFSRRLTGIVKVAFDGTQLLLEFRQSTTSVYTVTCRSGAFMIARRISDYILYA